MTRDSNNGTCGAKDKTHYEVVVHDHEEQTARDIESNGQRTPGEEKANDKQRKRSSVTPPAQFSGARVRQKSNSRSVSRSASPRVTGKRSPPGRGRSVGGRSSKSPPLPTTTDKIDTAFPSQKMADGRKQTQTVANHRKTAALRPATATANHPVAANLRRVRKIVLRRTNVNQRN